MPTKPSDFGPRRCSADSGTKGQHSRHWLTSCAGRSPSAAWGDTNLALSQLARQPGYGEQSELSRSCRRWFGRAPGAPADWCEKRRGAPHRPVLSTDVK